MIIEGRFNGPPGSGNGGWSAGVFATAYSGHGPVEVTLRRPPPLDTPLTLVDAQVRDPAGEVIAQLRPAGDLGEAVPPVDLASARAASAAYPGLVEHPFPGCYVCGPQRTDGLRIFPGRCRTVGRPRRFGHPGRSSPPRSGPPWTAPAAGR